MGIKINSNSAIAIVISKNALPVPISLNGESQLGVAPVVDLSIIPSFFHANTCVPLDSMATHDVSDPAVDHVFQVLEVPVVDLAMDRSLRIA